MKRLLERAPNLFEMDCQGGGHDEAAGVFKANRRFRIDTIA